MAIRIKTSGGHRNVMQEDFGLRENPFRVSEVYNPDDPGTYEPRMYGPQLREFYQKFFVLPLTKRRNRQVIGAVWSSQSPSHWRGFGKTMLMAEESKRICRDFGASVLRKMDVEEEDIDSNPILAGYCTFEQSKEIKSFAAALLDAVAFIVSQPYGAGDMATSVHEELIRRALQNLEFEEGEEVDALQQALDEKLRSYSGLNVQLTHPKLAGFMYRLCRGDTPALVSFIRHEIGPRIKANQGFNFVHVFNTFAALAGIVSVVYFIDQIENFAKWVRHQDRDIKILRESICQTSPTAELASFVFQMHIAAMDSIENWWEAEHLPSLDFKKPLNEPRVLNLKGLETLKAGKTLAQAYLADYRVDGPTVTDPLHPFSEDVIELVRDVSKGNPRRFLEYLGQILDNAVSSGHRTIDLAFVEPLLAEDYEDEATEEEDAFVNPER